ncbi:MAG: UDP-N-acetylmuramoyl-L-alanyl-D-glutamate--2,6-diaminopimelate ligase [Austwickia sp.]|nr:UDP-N-acetylmuramoyl-L-alanyl-D-glutamate--2,6-diaminopimelate ligase [Austwickia sp.]
MSSTMRPTHGPRASARAIATALGADLTGLPPTAADVLLDGVTLDSRQVRPGDLYAALPGAHTHGATFGLQAERAGAVAVLTDPTGRTLLDAAGVSLPRIVVAAPRATLGAASALLYGRPADDLLLIGITGTNGKTTTAYILDAALRALGHRTGLIGTIEIRVDQEAVPAVRTTPEACDLHGLFALMRERAVDSAVMEVSSHALTLHRVDGARYDVAVFTNLSQDHLDFHPTMEDYYLAKAALFTPERAQRGVVCVDDAWGARLAAQASIPVVTLATRVDAVGVGAELGAGRADWRLIPRPTAPDQDEFDLVQVRSGQRVRLRSALPGDFNRSNTALAALTLLECGIAAPDVERAMAHGARVPGRMERVELGPGAPAVYVDFAHTPEAIRATLAALRPAAGGRLIAVVGAGGNRDRGKRPLMGAAAARGADIVVVTDDNPRDEDPAQIRADVASGARSAGPAASILDIAGRSAGIAQALTLAAADDVVAVLGRGHETKQEVMGIDRPFDDRVAVRERWAQVAPA